MFSYLRFFLLITSGFCEQSGRTHWFDFEPPFGSGGYARAMPIEKLFLRVHYIFVCDSNHAGRLNHVPASDMTVARQRSFVVGESTLKCGPAR